MKRYHDGEDGDSKIVKRLKTNNHTVSPVSILERDILALVCARSRKMKHGAIASRNLLNIAHPKIVKQTDKRVDPCSEAYYPHRRVCSCSVISQ